MQKNQLLVGTKPAKFIYSCSANFYLTVDIFATNTRTNEMVMLYLVESKDGCYACVHFAPAHPPSLPAFSSRPVSGCSPSAAHGFEVCFSHGLLGSSSPLQLA